MNWRMKGREIIRLPEQAELILDDGEADVKKYTYDDQMERSNTAEEKIVAAGMSKQYMAQDVKLFLCIEEGELGVQVSADQTALREIILTWKEEMLFAGEILSDCWERSYGDLVWQNAEKLKQMQQTSQESWREQVLPWYFLDDRASQCRGYGVKVRPGAMCWWELRGNDLLLHLDVRSGDQGVVLKGRKLAVATVLMKAYQEDAFAAARHFCQEMCADSIYDGTPIYGSNNWYYAYGKSSRDEILLDAEYLARMTEGIESRPFMVIDDGWQAEHSGTYNGGPWDRGNQDYGDMRQLAEDMKKRNVRPGIWFRPLFDAFELPNEWRCMRDAEVLDVSRPEVLAYVAEDLQRIAGWGFEMVKHDFSTKDILGRWGFEMGSELTDVNWHFWDTSKTTAEIIVAFYKTIYQAAGNMVILGCNCIGHLGAGLMHVNRIGDDTSGVEWDRTRKMGVNTLAFRMPQHGTFFAADADCVGITDKIPWNKNRQWMKLLSESGTPFFVSVKPGTLNPEQEEELKLAYQKAAVEKPIAVPLDWKLTKIPGKWRTSDGISSFEW